MLQLVLLSSHEQEAISFQENKYYCIKVLGQHIDKTMCKKTIFLKNTINET